MIFVSSQKALSTEIKTVIKQQLENASNGWTAYRIARQASRMVSENTWRKMVCWDWRNSRNFFELDKGVRKIVGLGRKKWMREKNKNHFPSYIIWDTHPINIFSHLCFWIVWEGSKWCPGTSLSTYRICIAWLKLIACLNVKIILIYGSRSSMWRKEEKYTVPLFPSVVSQLRLELHRNPSMSCWGKFPCFFSFLKLLCINKYNTFLQAGISKK